MARPSTTAECFVAIDGTHHPTLDGEIRSALNCPIEATLTVDGTYEGLTYAAPAELNVGGRSVALRVSDAIARTDQTSLTLVDPAYLRPPEFRDSLLIANGGDNAITLERAMASWGVDCAPDDDAFKHAERGYGCRLPFELLDLISRRRQVHFWRDHLGARIGVPGAAQPLAIEVIDLVQHLRTMDVVADARDLVVAGDRINSNSGVRGTVLSVKQNIKLGAVSRILATIGELGLRPPRLIPVALVTSVISSEKPLAVILSGYCRTPAAAAAMFHRCDGGQYSETAKLIKDDIVRALVPTEGWAGAIEIEHLSASTAVDCFSFRIPKFVGDLEGGLINTKDGFDVNTPT